jgi:hypothetical protein
MEFNVYGADEEEKATNVSAGKNFGYRIYPPSAGQAMFKKFKYLVLGNETKKFSEKFTHTVWLEGGEYEVIGLPHKDSYLEFTVTDEDNLLGYGAGLAIAQYVYTEYFCPNRQWTALSSEGAKEIPAGFYLTVKHIGVGTTPENDIDLRVRYSLRRP